MSINTFILISAFALLSCSSADFTTVGTQSSMVAAKPDSPIPEPNDNSDYPDSESDLDEQDACTGLSLWSEAIPADSVNIEEAFAENYTAFDLGEIPGVRNQKYGGAVFSPEEPDSLFIAAWEDRAIYQVTVLRNADGHVAGFADDARIVAETSCGIDGGLAFSPKGDLHAVGFPCGEVFVIDPSAGVVKSVAAKSFDENVLTTGGALNFVPSWHPAAGEMKFANWPSGNWMEVPDLEGSLATTLFDLPGGIEGFAFMPRGSVGFESASIVFAEWNSGIISAYEIDQNANPIPATRRAFATGVEGAEGAVFDPASGDLLFTTWGDLNRIIAVRGFREEALESNGEESIAKCAKSP